MVDFSDYIIYVDESGDHGLESINSDYPVFVLAFCIIKKEVYSCEVVPILKNFKFDIFGHDAIVLHEHEITKQKGAFGFLRLEERRAPFFSKFDDLMRTVPMTVIAAAIRKENLCRRYSKPDSPYDIALGFCLERASHFLHTHGQSGKLTHIIAESRGRKEDNELELEFLRILQAKQKFGKLTFNLEDTPFEMKFAPKQANMTGLQIADLVARPIGRHVIKKGQPNRALEIIKDKLYTGGTGRYEEWGLKIFP